MWSDFNRANKAAMMKSEALSWPLTLALLVLAFGTLAAAGLPLAAHDGRARQRRRSAVRAAGQLFDVSIWAMNFAMMFAIALGIDYALFLVVRFRGALAAGLSPRDATVHTMATAGKAVLASGLTVVAALMAVMLVPVPTFRSVPLGIVLAVPGRARRDPHAAARRAGGARPPDQRRPDTPAQRALTIAASASPPGAAASGRARCPTAPPRF